MLELLLRFQHDPKPLTAVISGVLSCHASGSAAQGPDPAEQQQLSGSCHRPAKRARRGGKEASPAEPVPDKTREAQDAASRQPDAGKRDTAQQQADSRGPSGAAFRALRSIGASSADELDEILEYKTKAEPSSIQGLLDAMASIPGALSHAPLTRAPADHLILHLRYPVVMRSVTGVGAILRPVT